MYTYNGNSNSNYYIIKNGKAIAETFTGEDDASALAALLNQSDFAFLADGKEIDPNEKIKDSMAHYISNEPKDFGKILQNLIEACEKNPDMPLEEVEDIIVWEKVVDYFTVSQFCEHIGIE